MLDLINIFKISVPIMYLLSACFYGISFAVSGQGVIRYKSVLLLFAVLMHLVFLTLFTIEFKHPPITTIYEVLLTLSFTISFAYIFIEYITKIRNAGFVIILTATILVCLSMFFLTMNYGFQNVQKSGFISLHVISALIGYSAFTLSAAYGALYIILYKKLKIKKFDFIYKNIPNLEILELMLAKAMTIGFIALTISILIGVIWLRKIFPETSFIDIKLLYAVVVWLTYAIVLSSEKRLNLHGRKLALTSVIVLVLIFFFMALTNYLSDFHNF